MTNWIARWFRRPKPDPWIEPRVIDELKHADECKALKARLTELRFFQRFMNVLYVDEATGQHWQSQHHFINHWGYDEFEPRSPEAAARLLSLPELDPHDPEDARTFYRAIRGDAEGG